MRMEIEVEKLNEILADINSLINSIEEQTTRLLLKTKNYQKKASINRVIGILEEAAHYASKFEDSILDSLDILEEEGD